MLVVCIGMHALGWLCGTFFQIFIAIFPSFRAKQFREALTKKHDVDCGLAMIIKQRAKANEIERMDLVGSVKGCDAIIGKYITLASSIDLAKCTTYYVFARCKRSGRYGGYGRYSLQGGGSVEGVRRTASVCLRVTWCLVRPRSGTYCQFRVD